MSASIEAGLLELRPSLRGQRLADAVALWRHWFGGRSPEDVEPGVLAAFLARIDRDDLGARV